MKTIIAGSRGAHKKDTHEAIRESPWTLTSVVSGMARGPDSHAVEYASTVGIPLYTYPANWEKYGKSAGYIRNEEMAKNAEALIAVWDGESKGTKHMIDLANKHNLLVFVYYV